MYMSMSYYHWKVDQPLSKSCQRRSLYMDKLIVYPATSLCNMRMALTLDECYIVSSFK